MLLLVPAGALRGHTDSVGWGVWATVQGRPVLATGGRDGTVRVWDPGAGGPFGPPLTGHNGTARWGAWATVQGRPVLATGGDDGTVRVWDPGAGGPFGPPLTGHSGAVRWGAWATVQGRPVLATGGDDGSVRLWDPGAGAPFRPPLAGHNGMVGWGAWAATVQGRPILATGGIDDTVRLWDPTDDEYAHVLTGHTGTVEWGAWATVEGRPVLATGGDDGTVRMWNPGAGAPLGPPLIGHDGPVWWGAWATVEGRPILATGGWDRAVRLWDPSAGAPFGPSLAGNTTAVVWGAWATVQGRPVLATDDDDGTVRLWDPSTGTPFEPSLSPGHTGAVVWGAWAAVKGRPVLATSGVDGAVRLWELREVRVEARRRTGYRSDDGAAHDELDRTAEAAALAELIVARSARPPLAVGVFGDWGLGKTVFLRLLERQVQLAAGRGDDLSHDAVRQVRFNAWHYAETDLWASLVAEIFSQLAAPSEDDVDIDAGTLQRQQSRLAAELVTRRKIAERLGAARSRRDTLRRARAGRRWRVLPTEQREEISAAVWAADPRLASDGETLYAAASGALPWLRVQLLLWRRVWSALPWWAWVALLLTVGGAIGIGIQQWPLISTLIGGAGLTGLVVALAAARTAIGQVRTSISAAMETIKKVADGQRRQVDTAVAVAEREVAALERQLQDLTAAGALAGLAADRASEGGYRRNLGLMTQIREDFQQMATLLARSDQDRQARAADPTDPTRPSRDGACGGGGDLDAAGDALPRIDRIVLYIDDLDRCPPDRVVEVLEAVHLLLAVPLFVVVVAVDPRWLQQAVHVHYQAMLYPSSQPVSRHSEKRSPEVDPDDPQLWTSSPAQYLEKIFQIVFTLPPLATAGYTRMLDELTSARVEQPHPPTDSPEPPSASVAPTGPGLSVDDGAGADPEIGWDSAVDLPAAPVLVRVDPYALRADERTLMRLLGPPLITTPRAVKRLTNSYGLLAAIQRQTTTTTGNPNPEPDPAGGADAEVPGPAMVLLAALVRFAALGPALFTYLHRTAAHDPREPWAAFLSRLEPVCGENDNWANPASPDMTAVEAQSWRTLLAALRDITHNAAAAGVPLPEPVEAWARWIVPVGRLSFPTGRIVSSLAPTHHPTPK